METTESNEIVDQAKSYLQSLIGSVVRVTLSDGRIMEGPFECVDNSINMIVRDKNLGLVMVPGNHVAKCEQFIP